MELPDQIRRKTVQYLSFISSLVQPTSMGLLLRISCKMRLLTWLEVERTESSARAMAEVFKIKLFNDL
jgi:hypothetical protein